MSIRSLSSLRAKLTSGLLPVVYLLTVLVAVTAGFYASNAHRAANTISLPILVYPPDGASSHVESVVLTVDNPAGVDRLYVQAHQPYYHLGGTTLHSGPGFDPETAAEVRVNGGRWIPIDDEHVTCAPLEARHGCVAGGYSTIRFSVPARNVRAGRNVIEFKYNGSKGIRSGYRVLALGFMRGGDVLQSFDPFQEGAHDPSLLRHEEYSTWAPPKGYDNASDVAAGKALWHKQGLLVENILTGEPIRAACGSCHTTDGRDLKYFNYSNEVIVARSRFHGLSEKQGKQIAAYIRSLELRTDEGQAYEAPGTPWDPPYQPGPTALASRKPEDPRTTGQAFAEMDEAMWAAGAGLNWVLEKDIEMLPYVFAERSLREDPTPTVDRYPSGELDWRQVSLDSTLNMRLLPISAQLPDWNNWLPDIHPMAGQPTNYSDWADKFAALTATNYGDVVRKLQQFRSALTRRGGRYIPPSAGTDKWRKMAGISSYQWQAVKAFEKIQFGGYTDIADDLYCNNPVKPFCEPLAWPGTARFAFDIGPHINGKLDGKRWNNPPYVYGTKQMGGYYTHLWYYLQVVVNPGASPNSAKIAPVDWEYQRQFTRSAGQVGMRAFASQIKAMQLLSNGYGVDGNPNGKNPNAGGLHKGSLPATTSPQWFMQINERNVWRNLPEPLKKDLWMVGVRAWWDFNSRFAAEEFPQGLSDGRTYAPSTYMPQLRKQANRRYTEDGIYSGLYHGAQWLGLRAYPLIDSIAVWGAKMWPKTKGPSWEELAPEYDSADKPPVVRITNFSDGDTFSAPIDLVVKVKAHIAKGTIKKVELLIDGKKRAKKTKPPFRFTWPDVPPGRHKISVRATGSGGTRTTTSPITVTIEKPSTRRKTGKIVQRLSLKQGWNIISSRVRPADAKLEQLLADLLPDIILIKDETGATFFPNFTIDEIGLWKPHEAYMIYMRTDATLKIRGMPLSATAAIPLKAGWNLVPYWPKQPLSIEKAFAAIASDLVKVIDAAGRVYLPGQKNEIGQLKPGQGYKVYVSNDTRLTYPTESYAGLRHHPSPSPAGK